MEEFRDCLSRVKERLAKALVGGNSHLSIARTVWLSSQGIRKARMWGGDSGSEEETGSVSCSFHLAPVTCTCTLTKWL